MKRSLPLLALVTLLSAGASLEAGDWPQWRGPNRDGVAVDPNHPITKLAQEPKVLWKLDVGPGMASPIIAGNVVVYLDGKNGQEMVNCVDLASGKPLWSAPVAPMVTFSNYSEGPRCTPLVDGDRLYVQSSSGEFKALALATGKKLWETSFGTNYGATFLGNKSGSSEANETASRRHGNNGSAVVDGNLIFVPVGSTKGATLVAFDKMTGKEIWKAGTDNTAYSSVMVGTLGGRRQAVHFTADALMGVDAKDGKILWREPLKTGAKRHVCTPVISGDTVTVASTNIGTIKFHIKQEGGNFKADRDWTDAPLKTILGTPTLVGKNLFTQGGGNRTDLVCVDFATGNELWRQPGLADYASITAVNDKLLVLNSTGELTLVSARPDKYEELGRMQACGKTWSSPAYSNGRIIVKDDAHVTAIALTN
ncbi:MAG TPA: PQQ-binding-like beta-propeller repeat protein [Chthoniobacteraceae bacterium]|jgi:outer membrane protein assembly factor BamB|nr:PQQ-binding-like beta-propeller repeat protein [Chthoniobacteraceae bacterium]